MLRPTVPLVGICGHGRPLWHATIRLELPKSDIFFFRVFFFPWRVSKRTQKPRQAHYTWIRRLGCVHGCLLGRGKCRVAHSRQCPSGDLQIHFRDCGVNNGNGSTFSHSSWKYPHWIAQMAWFHAVPLPWSGFRCGIPIDITWQKVSRNSVETSAALFRSRFFSTVCFVAQLDLHTENIWKIWRSTLPICSSHCGDSIGHELVRTMAWSILSGPAIHLFAGPHIAPHRHCRHHMASSPFSPPPASSCSSTYPRVVESNPPARRQPL